MSALKIPIEVGQTWADKHPASVGRTVKVLKVFDDGAAEVETVTAAESAQTTQAVGRVTRVKNLQARFTRVYD